MKILTAETDLTSATNISKTPVVRIYNSDSSAITLTRKSNAGTTIGSYSVPSGKVIYCEKFYTDTLEGGAALKATGVGYSEELEIICLGSDSIGYVTSNLRMHLDSDSYSGSGDWLDATSNDNDGTIVGATFVAASGSDPAYFDFDGSNDRVDVTDTYSGGTAGGLATYDLMNGSNNFTVNIWFNTDSFPGGTSNLVSPILFLSGWRSVLLVHGDNGAVNHLNYRTNQGGWGNPVTSGILSTNTWYNVCVTYDNSSGYVLYLNGSSVATSNQTGTVSLRTNDTDAHIGGGTGVSGNRTYNGQIAVVSLYEETLTSSEATQNYNAFKSRYGY